MTSIVGNVRLVASLRDKRQSSSGRRPGAAVMLSGSLLRVVA
jgi:hypothetical protein